MIRDWLSRAVGAVVGGPPILLVPILSVFGAVTAADKLLMRVDRRAARKRVKAASDRATGERIKELVPGQKRRAD